MVVLSNGSSFSISNGAVWTALLVGVGGASFYLGQKLQELRELKRDKRSLTISSKDMDDVKVTDKSELVDVRIMQIKPLIPPGCLLEEMPARGTIPVTVNAGRQGVVNILNKVDDRLVVVVGPCSIHDPEAALEYARKLRELAEEVIDDLHVVMRVYFEKPRTTVGWKGLINDPDLNGTFNIAKGIRLARQLLLDINELGLPVGVEFLDTIIPQFTADLISWGAIGARTTESQLHRELTSGLSMPVGFKNGTGGSMQIAADAVISANHQHSFMSVSTQGLTSIVRTRGNPNTHIILRGGASGPNYEKQYVDKAARILREAGAGERIMIDCSHGNSRKIHTNQPIVCAEVGRQIAEGDERIMGVMIESNLKPGNQKLMSGKPLEYGKSITDACIAWEDTVTVLKDLAQCVQKRRATIRRHDSLEMFDLDGDHEE